MDAVNPPRVLLIGWDGADWKVITPLLEAGAMPNLERLINAGVMGDLATLYPSLSPMLWTSVATGKRPFQHGVCGFTEPDPHSGGVRPVTSLSRTTRALWNIFHLNGRTCNVVGWWPSHPAEPIRGVMVSDHYHRAVAKIDQPWPLAPGTVHPERLREPLADLRVHPQELTPDHIGPFVPDFGQVDQEQDHRLEMLARILAECTTIHAAATALIQLEPWDFMAVYYDALDHFGHGFMRYHPPRMAGIEERDFEIYQGVVAGGYRYHDLMLGALLTLAGEETTVLLMSDHGFHPDHRRPQSLPVEPAGPARQHREQGILVLKGPGIKSDERIYGASLLDVAPTLLTIFGLPVGEDLDGKVLVEAFETPPEVVAIPSWDQVPGEDGAHPPDRALHPLEAQEAIRQFVALGYIEKPDEDQEKAVAEAERERRYNLARSYMDAGRHLEAIPYLVELARDWPDAYRFGLRLVTCYQATGQLREARKALEELVDRKARNAAAAAEQLRQWQSEHEDSAVKDLSEPEQRELRRMQVEASTNLAAVEELMGTQLLAEGDAEGALVYFQNVELMAADDATGPTKMGQAYLALKRWAEAEGKFRQALDLEAERVDAWLGLARAGLGQRRNREAAEAALTAVGLGFHNPEAHFLLGVALHRMGRVPRAVEALRVAVAQNPNHAPAHERLAFIYENRLRDAARAEEHRRLARAAADRVEQLKAGGVSTGPAQFDRRPITPPLTLLEEHRTLSREMAAPLSETIVVVSGLPRSGTSLMMQMLAAGGLEPLTDHARPADAFNVEGYYEDERAKNLARDSSWLAEARGKALKVVVPLFPQIHPGPEYSFRVILMERPVSEVLASQKDMLLGGGRTGARLTDEQLHKVFTAQVNAAKRILALARVPTLYVAYHDCVQDPRGAAARVNEFLGGSLDEAAMAAAVRPDLRHHRHIV